MKWIKKKTVFQNGNLILFDLAQFEQTNNVAVSSSNRFGNLFLLLTILIKFCLRINFGSTLDCFGTVLFPLFDLNKHPSISELVFSGFLMNFVPSDPIAISLLPSRTAKAVRTSYAGLKSSNSKHFRGHPFCLHVNSCVVSPQAGHSELSACRCDVLPQTFTEN